MAVPALTANSPSAGFIAWASFTIQYNGVAYPVTGSNTNAIFTAWLYNAGSPLVVTNNNTPTNSITDSTSTLWSGSSPTLGPDDLLLFVNRSGVPINVQAASMLDGDLIVTGTVTSNAIATNTIVASNIAAGTITTGQIAASTITASNIATGTITATQIAANTITSANIAAGSIGASSLTVGTLGNNMIQNSMFEDIDGSGNITPWLGNWLSGSTATPVGSSTSPVIDGGRSGAITVTASLTGDLTSQAFPVTPGHTMYVNAYFAGSAINVKATVALVFGATQTFTNSGFVAATPAAATNVSVTDLSGNVQTGVSSSTAAGRNNILNAWPCAAASTIYMVSGQFVVPALAQWARLALVGAAGTAGVLYVDDAEVDDVILSAFIGNGQITANQIAANSITTSQLSATAINGMTITGATIIGGLIETQSGLTTGGTTKGVSISSTAFAEIDFYSGISTETRSGILLVAQFGSGAGLQGGLQLQSPTLGTGIAQVALNSQSHDGTTSAAVATLAATGTGGIINLSASDVQFNATGGASNSVPRGTVGSFSATTAQTATTTETALFSNICSTTIVSGRRYRITCVWGCSPSATIATASADLFVHLGSGTGGAVLALGAVPQTTTSAILILATMDVIGGTDITAGTQTFTISAKAATGSLVGFTSTNASNRTRLIIEDIGV